MRRDRDTNRLELNLQLLRILESYLRADPDMRFSQALSNLGYTPNEGEDDYYLEPSKLLERVTEQLNRNG